VRWLVLSGSALTASLMGMFYVLSLPGSLGPAGHAAAAGLVCAAISSFGGLAASFDRCASGPCDGCVKRDHEIQQRDAEIGRLHAALVEDRGVR
jgi:hypothetical protein